MPTPLLKKPLRVLPPKPRAAKPPSLARGVSWWVDLAGPDTPFQVFADAAMARDRELRYDAAWRQTAKLGQIGTL